MTDVASADWLCTFSRRRTHQTNGKVLERRRLAVGCLDDAASNFEPTASAHDETLCEYPTPTPTPTTPDPGEGGGGDATTETNSWFGMIVLTMTPVICCGCLVRFARSLSQSNADDVQEHYEFDDTGPEPPEPPEPPG